MLKGFDLSSYQSDDYDISGVDFVIVKVDEGKNFPDDNWEVKANRVLAAGKLLGLYHYARPDLNSDYNIEADGFVNYIRPYIGKAILALDWEGESLSQPTVWAKNWLTKVKQVTGATPFLYTSASVETNYNWAGVANIFPLWVAQYGVARPEVETWNEWIIWQFTDTPVDQNYFRGTAEEWLQYAGNNPTTWISKNNFLTQSEMENNATLFYNYFITKGWSVESICGMLGNIQSESTVNPGIWENLDPWGDPDAHGYGLVGWTPYTRITDWLTAHNYPIDSGEGQCAKIVEEMEHPEIEVTWIETDGYPLSFREFSTSTQTPEYLALAFLANYERPYDPNQPQRATQARAWYTFFTGGYTFVPRLDDTGLRNNPYYYDLNPFYQAGVGLPNCTCYAWGRVYEITNERPDKLSLGDGNDWYEESINNGLNGGMTPQLGAVLCTHYLIPGEDYGGHVSVVEQINDDGSIVVSNSGYPSSFFWIETLYPPDYIADWMLKNNDVHIDGFIYLPNRPIGPLPPDPPYPSDGMPWIYYLKLF